MKLKMTNNLITLIALLVITGCDTGYIVDKSAKEVTWTAYKPKKNSTVVEGADFQSFEIIKLQKNSHEIGRASCRERV